MAAVAMERTDEVIYCLVLLAFHSSRPVSFSASRVSIEFVWFYCFKDLLSCGPLQTIKRIQHVLPVGNSTSRPHSRSTYSRHYRTGVLSRCAKTSQLVFSLLFSFLVLFLWLSISVASCCAFIFLLLLETYICVCVCAQYMYAVVSVVVESKRKNEKKKKKKKK